MTAVEPEVTPDLVMERGGLRHRDAAERYATYANLRATGHRPTDAIREVGISFDSLRRYEGWLTGFRRALGLPPLPKGDSELSRGDDNLPSSSARGLHNRWHVGRGVTAAGCRHCRPAHATPSTEPATNPEGNL